MKKSELKNIILQEAIYIKNLVEEKKQIEETLKKIEEGAPFEEEGKEEEGKEVEETTGKGLGVQHRASHKGELGKRLKVEDELEEMSGLSQTASHQVGKDTTNPVYKSRKKRGYVNEEEKAVRDFVRKQLYESYGIKKA